MQNQALAIVVVLGRETDWVTGEQRRWLTADRTALTGVTNFNWHLPWLQVRSGSDPREGDRLRTELHAQIGAFHAALPFTEAERHWLCANYGRDGESSREAVELFRHKEAWIMSAGLQHVVRGRELLRRWWRWRRDVDEFEDQGAPMAAATALTSLASLLEAR